MLVRNLSVIINMIPLPLTAFLLTYVWPARYIAKFQSLPGSSPRYNLIAFNSKS